MADWLGMGGYGGYVWPAYGVTLLVMAGLLWQSLGARRKARAALAHLDRSHAP